MSEANTLSRLIPTGNFSGFFENKRTGTHSVNINRETKVTVRDKKYDGSNTPEVMLKRYLKGEKKSVIKRGLKILKEVR